MTLTGSECAGSGFHRITSQDQNKESQILGSGLGRSQGSCGRIFYFFHVACKNDLLFFQQIMIFLCFEVRIAHSLDQDQIGIFLSHKDCNFSQDVPWYVLLINYDFPSYFNLLSLLTHTLHAFERSRRVSTPKCIFWLKSKNSYNW